MGKRKREVIAEGKSVDTAGTNPKRKALDGQKQSLASTVIIQVVVGTYEKILHGIQATISGKATTLNIKFADTFLLSPHSAAIRCLAISPPSLSATSESQKVILASGSSDQVINLFHISKEAPAEVQTHGPASSAIVGNFLGGNARNRELGSLQHHGGSINAIYFPTRSKFLSAAEDNTVAVARTKDWTILSTIKAPMPKAHGRPSGDTTPLGGTPAGVNDFAVHPSMKLMVSVGKGEKCMRLWNLVTGKKAGVLNFDRTLLQEVGEGKWANGEGRRVEWNNLGEEFVVGFERGCVVFGMDCNPKSKILPVPATKVHQLHYAKISNESSGSSEVLAVSTEDGRIIFYSIDPKHRDAVTKAGAKSHIPHAHAMGQLGGATAGFIGRIKDFDILRPSDSGFFFIVTGSSDGAIHIWMVRDVEVGGILNGDSDSNADAQRSQPIGHQIGELLGTYEAGNRITCLKAFIMDHPKPGKTKDSLRGTGDMDK